MFVGHYSASFAARAFAPRAPLWVLLLAAQLVDVAWVLLVLGGVEEVRIDPTLASNPLDLRFMPYTHSLVAGLLWAGAGGALVAREARLGGERWIGAVVGATVLSHWVLDVLVHRPDMTLWPGSAKLGLALWDHPLPALALELGLLWAAFALAASRDALSGRVRRRALALVLALTALQLSVPVLPLPTSVTPLLALTGLVFVLVAAAGAWTERTA